MKNKRILRVLAALLAFVIFISSNEVYVYAEPYSNEIESYDDLTIQLEDELSGLSFSESEIGENNEKSVFNKSTEICTGSRLNYIKKYIVENGVKSENKYVVTAKLTNSDAEYSMIYNSNSDIVEFKLLIKTTSSSGTVANYETSFYAEDNAVDQMVFMSFMTESYPVLSYMASATINPAELKEDDIIDFSIVTATPESKRSEYEESLDETASLSLEVLLLGMDKWFAQLYDSGVTIGNFGFLSYKAPAANHIWSDWVDDEGQEHRKCDVCGETDEPEQEEDWKFDADTGIKWKISEGILTVNYEGFLEYIIEPWADYSEDVVKLILKEGITGFSEDVTYDLPNLKEIQIPASCINIDDVWSAFDFNDALEKIDVSSGNSKFLSVDGVLYNESGEKLLFYPHNKPEEVFLLPDTCTEIDDLFSNKVKELNLGSNLKTINGYIGGENVVLIRVPATLQNIGGSVFDVTEKLTNIIIDENNPYLCYENYALLSKDKKIIYEVMPCIDSTTYEIPDTVEEIFSEAFYNDNKIKELIIPKNVQKIGNGAFARMQKIEKICLLSTVAQFTGKPFSIVGKDEVGTFYVPNAYSKSIIEGTLKKCNIKNVNLIVDAALDVSGDESHEEKEPNDSMETAMDLVIGEKVLSSIGKQDKKDYFSMYIEREYAQTIYIENLDNINATIWLYSASGNPVKSFLKSDFKYDSVSNSYYNTFTLDTTGKYYICISSVDTKEVSYGIMYKNNSNDNSLDEEVAVESAKKYPDTVTAYSKYMTALKNYIIKHGEYENDNELKRRQYVISETGESSNELISLKYDIYYDGEEWISFSAQNYHNGLNGSNYPMEQLDFIWIFDSENKFCANVINYSYELSFYSHTDLRTEIDITNADYKKTGCNFKFISKNYSDIRDNEQLRKNAADMYDRVLFRWEDFVEKAEGREDFTFNELISNNGSSDLPSEEDEKDNYSVYYDDQRTDISDCTIADIKSKVYDGKAYTPVPKVTMSVNGKNKKLVYGTDYRLIYNNNINAGQGTVWVIGIGNYKGRKSKSFSITEKNIGKLTKVAGSIVIDDSLAEPIEIFDSTKLLKKGVDYDYTITEDAVSRKGTAKIMVSALPGSNYVGTTTVKVPVIDDDDIIMIESSDITLDTTEYNYDGRSHTPGVTVNVYGTELGKKDYSVTYKNNKNCGIAYVIVKGKGKSYTGTAIAFFTIVSPADKTSFDSVVVNKGKNLVYNGKLQKPKAVVMMNGKKLAVNKDYTLEYTDHFNAGQGKVKITGIGNYKGLSQDVTFTIEQREIKKASISAKSATNYTVKYAGKILVEGIDYEVESEEIPGTNKVNLKFTGLKNFSGEIIKKVKK